MNFMKKRAIKRIKFKSKKNIIDREMDFVQKEINEVESWVLARRKFFIKLGIIILFFLAVIVLNLFI